MWKKWLAGLLVVLGGLAVLVQLNLVSMAEKILLESFAELPAQGVSVKINSSSPWKLLQGQLDELVWQADVIQLQELVLEEIEGRFTGVEFNWWALLNQEKTAYSLQGAGEIAATLMEDNLRQYLGHHLDASVAELVVSINGEQIKLTGTWEIFGQKLPLLLVGHLSLIGTDRLQLVTEKIQVGSFAPGPEWQEKLVGNAIFVLPLADLPLQVEMYDLEGGQGRIIFKGRVLPQKQD